MNHRRQLLASAAALAVTLGMAPGVQAQAADYPTKPLTIVVPFAAGVSFGSWVAVFGKVYALPAGICVSA